MCTAMRNNSIIFLALMIVLFLYREEALAQLRYCKGYVYKRQYVTKKPHYSILDQHGYTERCTSFFTFKKYTHTHLKEASRTAGEDELLAFQVYLCSRTKLCQ